MTETTPQDPDLPLPPIDLIQLPESYGTFETNFYKHLQSLILTDSLGPVLQKLHPDGQYGIGHNCAIYWQLDRPERAAEAPDWFYVPNVSPTLDGKIRNSYILWRDLFTPAVILEFPTGNGDKERDRTPYQGKFWIYEWVMKSFSYAIYEVNNAKLEVYRWYPPYYHKLEPNEHGRYLIGSLGVELGLWLGTYQNLKEQLWLRWWDSEGNLLLIGDEKAKLEQQRAEQAEQTAAKLAEQLRALGIDPDAENP